jgi:cysteine desulfurase
MEPSHVLAAMGVPTDLARGAVRLTLGTTTTAADVDRGAGVLIEAVRRLRRDTVVSPSRPGASPAAAPTATVVS